MRKAISAHPIRQEKIDDGPPDGEAVKSVQDVWQAIRQDQRRQSPKHEALRNWKEDREAKKMAGDNQFTDAQNHVRFYTISALAKCGWYQKSRIFDLAIFEFRSHPILEVDSPNIAADVARGLNQAFGKARSCRFLVKTVNDVSKETWSNWLTIIEQQHKDAAMHKGASLSPLVAFTAKAIEFYEALPKSAYPETTPAATAPTVGTLGKQWQESEKLDARQLKAIDAELEAAEDAARKAWRRVEVVEDALRNAQYELNVVKNAVLMAEPENKEAAGFAMQQALRIFECASAYWKSAWEAYDASNRKGEAAAAPVLTKLFDVPLETRDDWEHLGEIIGLPTSRMFTLTNVNIARLALAWYKPKAIEAARNRALESIFAPIREAHKTIEDATGEILKEAEGEIRKAQEAERRRLEEFATNARRSVEAAVDGMNPTIRLPAAPAGGYWAQQLQSLLPSTIAAPSADPPPEPPSPLASQKTKKKKQTTKRRRTSAARPLTALQQQAITLYAEHRGDIAKVATAMGIHRSTAKQHLDAANKKLLTPRAGASVTTRGLSHDKRGQADVADSEEVDNEDTE